MSQKRIVVVGGGAGGLELVTKLGRKLGRSGQAKVTLVDCDRTHLWKPLLHEIATGVLDPGIDGLSYRSHSKNHYFEFQFGAMCGLDRTNKEILLSPVLDEHKKEVIAARRIGYDVLVLAVGSVSNDFGTSGVREHCTFLDRPQQAEIFYTQLFNRCLQVASNASEETVRVAIVGGGATGVELAAELYSAIEGLHHYGLDKMTHNRLQVTLVEAGQRILPALPERLSDAARAELEDLGVEVKTSTCVTQVNEGALHTQDGETISADLMVWAAGIKAPAFLHEIDGLESNRIYQLRTLPTLQTTRDPDIFVIGDCAACPQEDGSYVPPRAQSAHQMAGHVYKNIRAYLHQETLKPFVYRDRGSLISLSYFSAIGTLMGGLTRGSLTVEGRLARLFYISLYRFHQIALHGWIKTGLIILVGRVNRFLRPRVKLH